MLIYLDGLLSHSCQPRLSRAPNCDDPGSNNLRTTCNTVCLCKPRPAWPPLAMLSAGKKNFLSQTIHDLQLQVIQLQQQEPQNSTQYKPKVGIPDLSNSNKSGLPNNEYQSLSEVQNMAHAETSPAISRNRNTPSSKSNSSTVVASTTTRIRSVRDFAPPATQLSSCSLG